MLSPILWSKVWAFPWLTPSLEIHSRRSNILCDLNIERGMGLQCRITPYTYREILLHISLDWTVISDIALSSRAVGIQSHASIRSREALRRPIRNSAWSFEFHASVPPAIYAVGQPRCVPWELGLESCTPRVSEVGFGFSLHCDNWRIISPMLDFDFLPRYFVPSLAVVAFHFQGSPGVPYSVLRTEYIHCV